MSQYQHTVLQHLSENAMEIIGPAIAAIIGGAFAIWRYYGQKQFALIAA